MMHLFKKLAIKFRSIKITNDEATALLSNKVAKEAVLTESYVCGCKVV